MDFQRVKIENRRHYQILRHKRPIKHDSDDMYAHFHSDILVDPTFT